MALAFLTALPVRGEAWDAATFRRSVACYPYVGLLIGAFLVAAAALFFWLWPSMVAGVLVLALWLVLTGMLHLDGLLDVADALFLAAPPARRREVMADPAIGAFAFGAGAVHLLLKAALVAAAGPSLALFFAPVWARTLLLLAVWRTRPADGGLGARVAGGGAWWGLLPGIPALAASPVGAVFALVAALLLYRLAERRLGEVRGDVFGALVELAEVAFLLGAILKPGV